MNFVRGFCCGVIFMSALIHMANAAEYIDSTSATEEMNITGTIINAEDTAEMCSSDFPPWWCPEHLRNIEPEAGYFPLIEPEAGGYVENPIVEDKVYE